MNTTGELRVEPLDSEEIHRLDLVYFPHPWTAKQWLELNPDQNILLSWRTDKGLVGYGLFGFSPDDDVAHLFKIFILPSFRKTGVASHFWSAILQSLKFKKFSRVYLEVGASNSQAIGFYVRCGFRLLHRNKGYYSNGEDALMMELTL